MKAARCDNTISQIPWIHGYDWVQVSTSIAKTIAAMDDGQIKPLKKIVEQIGLEYDSINDELELVCKKTCVSCLEVCCMHATVWYDLRDLIYLYLDKQTLPQHQIQRLGNGPCCELTSKGCMIDRSRRPFICTWYICSSQKEVVSQFPQISKGIKTIQQLRKQLEAKYILSSFSS